MSSNHLGARSKIRIQPESNSRKGKKKGQNGNSCGDNRKLWEAPTERNQSSRNASMDTWDNVPPNAWNKKDSWEESMRKKKKETPTVWSSIEQEFPSLGNSQQASQKNVWTERQKKFEEVKSIEPTNEDEEEKMLRIALEMSKFDVESDEAKRRRLQEEYLLQEEMLKANPDYFKDFVPAEELYNTSNNNNWDTWNDYTNLGIENDAASKSTSGWNDSSLGTSKSTLQTNSKQKDYESIWGIETDKTNSDNWNCYSDSGSKKKPSTKGTSNYNNVDNFNDPPLEKTQQSKSKIVTKNENYDGVWDNDDNCKKSDGWNDYSNLGAKKSSTIKGATSYKNDSPWDNSTSKSEDGWNEYSGSSDKKNSTAIGTTSYKNDNSWNDSTGKSKDGWNDYSNSADTKASSSLSASNYKSYSLWDDSACKAGEQSIKNSSKKSEKCDEIWGNDADYDSLDNWNDSADARDKRNYSNLEATSSHDDELVLKKTKINELDESKIDDSGSKSPKMEKNISKAGRKKSSDFSTKGTEDIKKVIDLFGGWGSASDFSRKPKNVGNIKNATDNLDHNYKKVSNQKVANGQSSNPTTAETSQSTSKPTMQNSSMNSENKTFQNSMKEIEEKTAEIKLSEDIKSVAESQNTYFSSEVNQFPEESVDIQKNYLTSDDCITIPTPKISDFPEFSDDVSTTSAYNSNVSDYHKANQESFTELYSLNERFPSDSSSVNYIRSPKAASLSSESAGISKPNESLMIGEHVSASVPTSNSNNLSSFGAEEASQATESYDNKLESPVINSPSTTPPTTDLPFEASIKPILPITPIIGGFMNPNMIPAMNPGMIPGMNPSMMAGMNPMMVGGMNPLLMQQMLFLSNPFLASQIRAMEMYYRSMGMTAVPQAMFPPQMCSVPAFNGSAFPNVMDDNCNNTVPPNNCDINDSVANIDTPVINPPMYTPNNKLSFPLNDNIDTSSHILKYDPDDADSLLQQFLEPCDNDKNFIPPPVMPNSRNGNSINKQSSFPMSETYNPTKIDESSFLNPLKSDHIGNEIANGANSESSWNGAASAKEPIAAVPESTGWGDFDSVGMKSDWNEEIDGWGNENYTMKAMGNASKYDTKKRNVNRQPSSQPAFSRYKK